MEVLQFLGPRLLDELVLQRLPGEIVAEVAAVALCWTSQIPLDLRVLVWDLHSEASILELAVSPQLVPHALDDCTAQSSWIYRRVLGVASGAQPMLAPLWPRTHAVHTSASHR